MSLIIHYTPKAKKSLKYLYAFIEGKFGKRHADKFITKTGKTINLPKEQPFLFKKSELGEPFRLGLIAKNTSFIYEVTEDKVILHFFWDNRQDPFYE